MLDGRKIALTDADSISKIGLSNVESTQASNVANTDGEGIPESVPFNRRTAITLAASNEGNATLASSTS